MNTLVASYGEPSVRDRLVTDSRESLTVAVRTGAAFLDSNVPYWWDRIDVATLDLSCGQRCIIGQLYCDVRGEFFMFVRLMFSAVIPMECSLHEAVDVAARHGFFLPTDSRTDYATLTDLWHAEILARRRTC